MLNLLDLLDSLQRQTTQKKKKILKSPRPPQSIDVDDWLEFNSKNEVIPVSTNYKEENTCTPQPISPRLEDSPTTSLSAPIPIETPEKKDSDDIKSILSRMQDQINELLYQQELMTEKYNKHVNYLDEELKIRDERIEILEKAQINNLRELADIKALSVQHEIKEQNPLKSKAKKLSEKLKHKSKHRTAHVIHAPVVPAIVESTENELWMDNDVFDWLHKAHSPDKKK